VEHALTTVQCLDIHVRQGCPVWGGAARSALPKAIKAARSAAENSTSSGDAWAATTVGVDMPTGGERATHGVAQPPPRPPGASPAVHGARAGRLPGLHGTGATHGAAGVGEHGSEERGELQRYWYGAALTQWCSSVEPGTEPRVELPTPVVLIGRDQDWESMLGRRAVGWGRRRTARGSRRRGGWLVKQLRKSHKIILIARKTRERAATPSRQRPDRTVWWRSDG
jgi:hypothetical protein